MKPIRRCKALGYIFPWIGVCCFLFLGTSFGADQTDQQVTLWVSKGFGTPPLIQKTASLGRASVLELLQTHADVTTAYGGGFVAAINGLQSTAAHGRQADWFYYINGFLAHVGASSYYPAPQDHIWWVYTRWSEPTFIPAVIGAYPQPFVSGYGGRRPIPLILYHEALADEAYQLAHDLKQQGARDATLRLYAGAIPLQESAVIAVLCPWPVLQNADTVKTFQQHAHQVGWWLRISTDGVELTDLLGEPARRLPAPFGAMFAVRHGEEPGAAVWFITGSDILATRRATHVLLNTPEHLRGRAGVVMAEDRLWNIPYAADEDRTP